MEPNRDEIDATRPGRPGCRQLSHLSRLGGVKGIQRVRRPRVGGRPPAPDLDDRPLPVDLGQDVDFPSTHSQIASQYQMASALQKAGSQFFGGSADVLAGEMIASGVHSSGMPQACDIPPRSTSPTLRRRRRFAPGLSKSRPCGPAARCERRPCPPPCPRGPSRTPGCPKTWSGGLPSGRYGHPPPRL